MKAGHLVGLCPQQLHKLGAALHQQVLRFGCDPHVRRQRLPHELDEGALRQAGLRVVHVRATCISEGGEFNI